MQATGKKNIADFWCVGLNYKKSDAAVRGKYAISQEQYNQLLETASSSGIHEFFILSTCNRTEIYGFAPSSGQLIDFICTQTEGDAAVFTEKSYIQNGLHAIEHLFNVSAGLDSQILGDYEILGQIKQSVKASKNKGFIGAFMERLINSAIQSSKAVKTHTQLSSGSVSVAFAAAEYIRKAVGQNDKRSILLLGTGKIGRNACKNLVDVLNTRDITLINRTQEKADALAKELGLRHAPIDLLDEHLAAAGIILVATNAPVPVVTAEKIKDKGAKLIIDLSIPANVAPEVRSLPGVTLISIDELSRIKDETLQQRKAEVPRAQAIIRTHITEFSDWLKTRKYAPVLKSVKHTLHELNELPVLHASGQADAGNNSEHIQKVIDVLAVKIRKENTIGCHCIEAINTFIGQKVS